MKKLLLVVLVYCSLMMSLARAQDSLTLYGLIDMGLQYNESQQEVLAQGQRGTFFGIASGVQSGSRFGLRGISDLGNGTKILFVLENGFNPANGTAAQDSRLFGRQSTIGLSNVELGRVDFGRQINLASQYFMTIDPFAEGFGQANIGASFGSANTLRYSNMVLLQSRPIGGLTVGAGYSFATDLTSIYAANGSCSGTGCHISENTYQYEAANNLRALTLGLKYQQGPLLVSAAYDQLNGPANIPNGPPSPSPSSWLLGAAYDLETVTLSAAYGQARNGSFVGQPAGTGAAGTALLVNASLGADILFASGAAHDSYLLGINMPLKNGNVLASWQMMRPVGDFVSAGVANQVIYSAGYLYNFSKRTNLYTYVSYANNYAMVNSAQSTMVGIGLRHQF
jgi:predicted porin